MFDILIFTLITLFFGYKLYVALGRTSDDETDNAPLNKNHHDSKKIVREFPPTKAAPTKDVENTSKPRHDDHSNNIVLSREEKDLEHLVQKIEDQFSMIQFKQGVEKAFRMIVEAFAQSNKTILRKLLSEELFQTFETDIDVREEANVTRETRIESIESINVRDVSVDDTRIRILVEIESKQTIWEQDDENNIIEGDDELETVIYDTWVFVRDINSTNRTWFLETTNVT